MRIKATGAVAIGALAVVLTLGSSAGRASSIGDGAQVHGHWTISVVNRDGSVAASHEFENALTESGQDALVRLLGDTGRAGTWLIFVGTRAGHEAEPPCGDLFGDATGCMITAVTAEAEYFEDGGDARILLSGDATATQDGSIGFVATLVQTVACDSPVAECTLNDHRVFTETEPRQEDGSLFEVSSGQMIQVQVEITFS